MTRHELLVEEHDRWERRLSAWWKVLIAVSFVAILVTTSFVVVTLVQVQQLAQVNANLNSRLVDCTTPGHACYDEGQKRTGQAVVTLNEVTKAAVICADQPGVITQATMESCLNKQLGR